ncbi:hypothetical protein C8R46DRAFT_1357573 [Mycena filopes]|nr:hypothetical protein C8R46DRAFT_1357573 [Mycena filopes]
MATASESDPQEPESDSTRLNKEGGELFKLQKYEDAAKRYQSAILADSTNSPLYFSNLSAAYLKLGRFPQAESAANTSLIRDPRSVKARYRRAMARKEQGHLAEALVDLTSLLTTSPGNTEAATALREISALYVASGEETISLEDVVIADFPHAFGSPSVLEIPRATQATPLSTDGRLPPGTPSQRSFGLYGMCTSCKITKDRKDMKTCQKCKRVTYCNATCQRADWVSGHKETCNRPSDNNQTFRLGRQLTDHTYISTHLTAYAVRALALTPPTAYAPPTSVLLAMVDMVPLMHDPARKRIRIKHLLAAPLVVLPPEVVQCSTEMLRATRMRHAARGDMVALVSLLIGTLGVYPDGEETRFRASALPAQPHFFRPDFGMALRSHSRGEERRITMDLDLLYSNLEDELAHDVENHYRIQD